MKSKKEKNELDALKKPISKKLLELKEDELKKVTGGELPYRDDKGHIHFC